MKLNTFQGGINTDSNEHFVEDGDYRDATNIESVTLGGDNLGVLKNIKGNESVTLSGIGTLPTGSHICIGTAYDGNNDIVQFYYNSDDQHFVARDSEIIRISPVFNFTTNNKISHATILNQQFLIWTDGDIDGTRSSFKGNPVRMLDLVKASRQVNYRTKVVPSVGRDKDFEFTVGSAIALEVWGINAALVTTIYIYVDITATGGGLSKSMLWLKGKIETALAAYSNDSVEYCDDGTLVINSNITFSPNYYYIVKEFSGVTVFSYPENFYENELKDWNIDLYARHPKCSPVLDFLAESKKGKRFYQFRCRYVYQDGRKSTWSDISLLSLRQKYDMTYEIPSDFDVRLVDDRLEDSTFRTMLKRIEFAVREGDNGVWKKIDSLKNEEVGNGSNVKVQFNDAKMYAVIESDDNTIGTNQTLKIFDFLPITTDTLDVASDSTGSTRLFIGGGIEGYDLPCVNTEYEINTELIGITDMVKITGEVRIVSQYSATTVTPDFEFYNGGFPVYLAGTPFFAMSDNPNNSGGNVGTFEFYAPRGEYLLRVANWKCRYDDDNGIVYNMTSGLEWQNTSSPVMGFNGVSTGNELIVDTTTLVGSVYDIGYIEIHNQHHSLDEVTWISGYLRDNYARSETTELRRESLGMPLSEVSTGAAGVGLKTYTTDHNGYFFFAYHRGGADRYKVTDLQVTVRNNATTQLLLFADYQGDEQDRQDGSDLAIGGYSFGGGTYTPEYTNGYINLYATWWGGQIIDLRKTIRGQVLDTNGDAAQNVIIAMQNGMVTRTDELGNFQLVGYTPVSSATLPVYLYARPYWDFTNDIAITTNPISNTSTLNWSTNLLENMDFEISPPSPPSTTRWLKAGGGYKIGIGYADKYGRKTPVIPLHEVEIPYHSEYGDLAKQSIGLVIKHQAPSWADKWFLYRTKNTVHENYAQIYVADIKYAALTADGEIRETTFELGSHILIRLKAPNSIATSTGINLFGSDTERIGYAISEGDYIRPLLSTGNLIVGDNEAEVIDGTYTDADNSNKVWNILKNTFNDEIKPGDVIEVFTPSITDRDIYYLDSCYDVVEDNDGRWHDADVAQELNIDGYARFKGGDTYWRYRDYYNDTYMAGLPLENINVTDTFKSDWEDIGIANVEDEDYNGSPKLNTVRFSGVFIKDTNINDLSAFKSTDYHAIGSELGGIRALKNIMDNLLAICNFDTQPIYVGKSPLLDLSGGSQIGKSSEILNIANNTRLQHGTTDPTSIIVSDGRLFCYDRTRKKFWKYDGSGVNWINGQFDTYIKNNIQAGQYLVGALDLEKNSYKVLLVEQSGDVLNGVNVLNYDFLMNKWKPREIFIGHWIWYSQRRGLTTAYNNLIWRHNTSVMSLYGTPFTSTITFETKGFSGDNVFMSILLNATRKPFKGTFAIKATSMTPTGQYTEILQGMWRDTMNKVGANIPRDHNDVKYNVNDTAAEIAAASIYGRVMKGETVVVSLIFNNNFELINSTINTIEFKNT